MKREIEVLAPAGSYTSLKAAIAAGADAVYVGGSSFGARAFANNFTEEELLDAIDYVHFHGKKIFLTVNTLLKEEEIEEQLYDYLLPYYRQGLDAVIVQDVGVLELVREFFPDIAVHASTQMTITNTLGARLLKSKGAERVVPARELSLPEIRDMAEDTGLEIECFVHGALCYCYSGQCLLSSMIGGRSGNRGQCAQPCRLPYEAEGQSGFLLSPKDICTLELIPEMIEAGIYSFKIEGRMKKPEYVAAVVSMYRKYVDLYFDKGKKRFSVDPKDKQMLMDVYNRGGFDGGYYKKHNGAEMISIHRPNHAGVPAFRVISQKNRDIKGEAVTDIHKGDILELTKEDNYTFGQDIRKGDTFTLIGPKNRRFSKGTVLSRTRNQTMLDTIQETYIDTLVREPVTGKLVLRTGEKSALCMTMRDVTVWSYGEVVEEAKNQPLDQARIEKQMRKTGNTEFAWENLQIETEGTIFVPMQQLNELRRNGLEELHRAVCEQHRREDMENERSCAQISTESVRSDSDIGLTVLAETMEQFETAAAMNAPKRIYVDGNIISHILSNEAEVSIQIQRAAECGKEIYFAMPHIFRANAVKEYEVFYDVLEKLAVSGVLIRNYESYQFLREHGFRGQIMTDSNLYVFNRFAKQFWQKELVSQWTTPVELSQSELCVLDVTDGEFIGYGYLPVMISAGCIRKTTGKCSHISGVNIIKDRLKNKYTVKNYCDFCYNVMYNTSPLVLYDRMEEIREMNPKQIRLQFATEDGAETRRIIGLYQSALEGETEFPEWKGDFTRGHFRRGIK